MIPFQFRVLHLHGFSALPQRVASLLQTLEQVQDKFKRGTAVRRRLEERLEEATEEVSHVYFVPCPAALPSMTGARWKP